MIQQPEVLKGKGAMFAQLLAYTTTTQQELFGDFGERYVRAKLHEATPYVSALDIERGVHGPLREDFSHIETERRIHFVDNIEAIALLDLARCDFRPSSVGHLRLLVWRMGRLTEFEPDYVGRLEQQLTAAGAAVTAMMAIQKVQSVAR